MKTSQAIALLFLLSGWSSPQAKRSTAPSARAPSAPRKLPFPPQPEPDEEDLFRSPLGDPKYPGYPDLLWIRYAKDPTRPGPKLSADDLDPFASSRKLTPFQRWAVAPFFPVADDLEHTIHNGKQPPGWEKLIEEAKKQYPGLNERLIAAKTEPPNGDVWVLWEPRPLWHRAWLGILVHELTHAAQLRLGMTLEEGIRALQRYGYGASPIEIQAEAARKKALRALYLQARDFYRNKR